MTTQHTPGPWHIYSKLAGPLHIETANGVTIAHVGFDDFPTCQANARLIAASPTLLASLRQILDALNEDPIHQLLFVSEINDANDAIAKAEGE